MKKTLLVILAVAMAMVSCKEQKDETLFDGETTVFRVAAQYAPRKANTTPAVCNVDRFILQIEDLTAGLVTTETNDVTPGTTETSFKLKLIYGHTYNFLFWADTKGIYDVTDLNAVAIDPATYAGNNADRDAFYASMMNKTVDAPITMDVTLTRPFAQLNIVTTDLLSADQVDVSAGMKVKFTAPTKFNVATGEASDPQTMVSATTALYGETADGQTPVTMDYVFVTDGEKELIDFTYIATGIMAEPREFTNVPVERNYRTNLIGELFTAESTFNVNIDQNWGDEEIDFVLWNGEAEEVPAAVNDTITITTPGQLAGLAASVNSGTSYAGKVVVLGKDINLDNQPWTAIGNVTSYPSVTFNGIFDGQDHIISNVNCTDNTVNYACAGLFGSLNGTIKNLTVQNVTIISHHYAGAICGYSSASASTITNCHVIGGNITSTPEWLDTEYDNGDKVGGIIGYCVNGDKVTNCTVEDLTIIAYRDLGGIVGAANATITGCSVTNTTIIQDNTNGYKTGIDTYHEIIGRDLGATMSDNTFNNVTLETIKEAKNVASQTELNEAVAAAVAGDVIKITVAGTYTIPNIGQNITLRAETGVKYNCEGSGSIASVPNGATFEGGEFTFGQNNYHGFQHAGTINMKGCTLNGKFFSYGVMNFDQCTFIQNAADYHMWMYGTTVTYNDCTFKGQGKFINVYNEGDASVLKVVCNNCYFESSVSNKAALNIKETCGTILLKIEAEINNCTTNANFPAASTSDALFVASSVWQVDDRYTTDPTQSNVKVTVDGEVKYINGQPVL